MKNDAGSLWGYVWMSLTGFFTALSIQDISIIFGAVITAALGVATYVSNDRRNKRMAAAAEVSALAARERNVILAQHYRRYDNGDRPEDAQDMARLSEADG